MTKMNHRHLFICGCFEVAYKIRFPNIRPLYIYRSSLDLWNTSKVYGLFLNAI